MTSRFNWFLTVIECQEPKPEQFEAFGSIMELLFYCQLLSVTRVPF